MGVQGHHIQVVGIAPEDVFNQVCRTGERSFWVDSRLTAEGGVSGGSHFGGAGSIDPNRWEWPVFAETDSPRIEEHAGEIAGVVDMKMREEDGLQAGEVETGRRECGRRTPPAVDHEDPFVDHQRRTDTSSADDWHRCSSCSKQHQLGCHGHLPNVGLLLSSSSTGDRAIVERSTRGANWVDEMETGWTEELARGLART